MSATILEVCPRPEPPPHATAVAPRWRHAMLDVCRLWAAYAIVWLHTPRPEVWAASALLGRFAVPFFTAAATLFAWQSGKKKGSELFSQAKNSSDPFSGVKQYVRSRLTRIYVPFLAWSGVYLAFKGVKALLLPSEPNDFPGVELLWLGSFFHLWFMPFVLLVTVAVFCLAYFTAARLRERSLGLGETIVLVLSLAGGGVSAWLPSGAETGTVGFGQLALDALPSACWGFALAIAYGRGGLAWLKRRGVSLAMLAVAVGLSLLLVELGRNRLVENLSGVALLCFALGDWTSPRLDGIARLGPLAYGIYLSHLLFIKTLEAVVSKLHMPLTLATSLGMFAVAAAGSTLLAWLLSRSRWTRWLTAG